MTWPHTGKSDEFVLNCLAARRYDATPDGHILNLNYRGTGRTCQLRESITQFGYLRCTLFDGAGRSVKTVVHRVICLAFHGPAPADGIYEVNHINGDKRDNRPQNLEWLTVGDNARHAYATSLRTTKGIGGTGEQCARSKLTAEQVSQIFEQRAMGKTHREIADHFAVTSSNVSVILTGKSWADHPCNAAKKGPPRD